MMIYGAKCYVLHRRKISGEFEVESEVCYECILAPTVFLFGIVNALHIALTARRDVADHVVFLQIPADDICLL